MANNGTLETHPDCNACLKHGLTDFMAPETLCPKHRAEYHDKANKAEEKARTFVFTDEYLKNHPEMKREFAVRLQALVVAAKAKERAAELLHQLQELETIGFKVELTRLPSPEEEQATAVKEARDAGYAAGKASIKRDLKKVAPVAISVALYAAILGAGILYLKGVRAGADGLREELKAMGTAKAARWYFGGR